MLNLRVLFWSGVLIEGSIWWDESGRRICFRPFGRVFRFIGFLKPSTGSVRESAEPGFGHDRTTFGSTGDDRDGPTGILHRWKSVINSSRPLKVFLWVLKIYFEIKILKSRKIFRVRFSRTCSWFWLIDGNDAAHDFDLELVFNSSCISF